MESKPGGESGSSLEWSLEHSPIKYSFEKSSRTIMPVLSGNVEADSVDGTYSQNTSQHITNENSERSGNVDADLYYGMLKDLSSSNKPAMGVASGEGEGEDKAPPDEEELERYSESEEPLNQEELFMGMIGLTEADFENVAMTNSNNTQGFAVTGLESVLKKAASGLVETIDSTMQHIDDTGNTERLDLALRIMNGVSYGTAAARGASIGIATGSSIPGVGTILGGVVGAIGGITQNYAVERVTEEGVHLAAQALRAENPSLNERESETLALFGMIGMVD